MALTDLTNTLARTAVKSVTVRTTLSPDVTVDPFADREEDRQVGAQGGPVGLLLSFLRPSVYVDTPAGVVPVEPYGPPDSNYVPLLLGVGALGLGALFYLAYRGLKSTRVRKLTSARKRKR